MGRLDRRIQELPAEKDAFGWPSVIPAHAMSKKKDVHALLLHGCFLKILHFCSWSVRSGGLLGFSQSPSPLLIFFPIYHLNRPCCLSPTQRINWVVGGEGAGCVPPCHKCIFSSAINKVPGYTHVVYSPFFLFFFLHWIARKQGLILSATAGCEDPRLA
jgi:hypothetical protein